jgi:signal transduction histidine kinase
MKALTRINLLGLAALLLWTLVLAGLLWYDLEQAHSHTDALARKEARANYNKDQAFRLWATQHGGVYVPKTERTPPNPALAHIPERDIETPSGKKLTLMNPAYMVRQMMEEYGDLYGIKGKITSFKLMNPNNAPDAWEAEAMHQFEKGTAEVFEYADLGGEPYLRLMGTMVVKPGCLKCHAFQGYQVGDVRGGVGVSVPMRGYLADLNRGIVQKTVTFGVIWAAGLVGIVVFVILARKRQVEQAVAVVERERHHVAIEKANAELTQFANISAHHLMEPSRRLLLFARRLRDQHSMQLQDEDARLSLGYIEQGAARMRDLVRDIERYLAAALPRGPLQPMDLAPVIAEVERRLAAEISERGARITTEKLLPVVLDPPRLMDLFEVLIANSLIHAEDGNPPRVRISCEPLPAAVRVRVEDNGPGIVPEYRERVFGVFERLTQNPRAGTGIGLAIARRIVESRNGRIWIEAPPQGGTSVVFDLPNEGSQ